MFFKYWRQIEFEDKYVFTFHKLTKSWWKCRPPLSVEFCAYQQNPKLCVVQAIKSYLQVTQAWRNKNGQKQLLLSTLVPHQEVKKSTVAGWVKAILSSAGIDTNLFTAHSTRTASTSKGKLKGLLLEVFWNEVIGPINQHDENIITNLFQMSQLIFKKVLH